MLKKVSLFLIMLCVVSISFFGCSKKDQVEEQAGAPLVKATQAIKLDVPWNIEYPAQVAGSLEVEVRAQVGGILKERLYQEGQFVEKDEILFTIDPQEYKIALERAQASLEQANTEVQRTKRDYNRMKDLISDNAVSQKDYDDSLSAYERSQANYKAAKAVVDDAKRNLGYTKVKAPVSGIARKETHSVGSLISIAGEESLLTTMVKINPVHVNFSLPSRQIARLKEQVELNRMTVSDDIDVDIIIDGRVYDKPGKIIFLDSAEDPNTSAVAVKVEVENPVEKRALNPGQFIKVRLKGITFKDAVIIPQSCIIDSPNGQMVYVINKEKDNTVEACPVSAEIRDSIAVVYSGLKGKELVVSGGSLKLAPGVPVTVEMAEIQLPDSYKEAYRQQYGDLSPAEIANLQQGNVCQSCGWVIEDDKYFGTEADGSKSKDYCRYCYKNGKFTLDKSLDEFIPLAAKYLVVENDNITEEEAISELKITLPKLKRWNTQTNTDAIKNEVENVDNKEVKSENNVAQQDNNEAKSETKKETVEEQNTTK